MKTTAILLIALIFLSCTKEEIEIPIPEPVPNKLAGLKFTIDIEVDEFTFTLTRQGSVLGEFKQTNGEYTRLREGYYLFSNLKGIYEDSEIGFNNISLNGNIKSVIGRAVVFEIKKDKITEVLIIN